MFDRKDTLRCRSGTAAPFTLRDVFLVDVRPFLKARAPIRRESLRGLRSGRAYLPSFSCRGWSLRSCCRAIFPGARDVFVERGNACIEGRGISADFIERSQWEINVERRVFKSLCHNRARELLPAADEREAEPRADQRVYAAAPRQQHIGQKVEAFRRQRGTGGCARFELRRPISLAWHPARRVSEHMSDKWAGMQ